VVVVEVADGPHKGRGEAVPYAHYGETVEGVLARIADVPQDISREGLQGILPPGAARNALDCALWDLEAKRQGVRAWTLAGLRKLDPVKTCLTISLGAPEAMADAARREARRPMLKLKLGGPDDLDRVEAVRAAAPKTRLIVDANEALSFDELRRLAPSFARLGVQLIEQPLPAGEDAQLDGYDSPVPLCADETVHTQADLPACRGRYAAVNIKLDKAGGLTEALVMKRQAQALGFEVMVGSMVSTSLAVAPALLVAQGVKVVDLDGPLLLAKDREPGLNVIGSLIEPPPPELWG
jgi:L-Ala-D/L-Glu epimerase